MVFSLTKKSEDEMQKLNDREILIIDHIAKGYTTKDIAENMNLSENTVDTYVKIILLKLGAINRPNMVYLAQQRGLL